VTAIFIKEVTCHSTILFVTLLGFGMLPGILAFFIFSLGFTGNKEKWEDGPALRF